MRTLIAGVAAFVGSLWSIDSWPTAGPSEPTSARALRNRRRSRRRLRAIHPAEVGRARPSVGSQRNTVVLDNPAFARPAVAVSSAGEPLTQVLERSKWERRYARNLRITDTIVVVGAVILAQYVWFGSAPTAPGHVDHYVTAYSALLVAIWLAALTGFRARSPRYIGTGIEEYRRVVAASFGTFGAIAMAELLVKLEISRGYLAVALPAGVLGLVLNRCLWRKIVAHQRVVAGRYQTAVLAIGERSSVANLASELTDDPNNGYRVVGVVIPGYGPPRGEHLTVNDREIPIVGGETAALQAIHVCGADTVAIAGTEHFGFQGIRRLFGSSRRRVLSS